MIKNNEDDNCLNLNIENSEIDIMDENEKD